MSLTATKALIEKLCAAFGPSGLEDEVARVIIDEVGELATPFTDRMGNVIYRMSFGNEANRKKIMVSAHMDEVGFMINDIKSSGLLGFGTVGGISETVMAGRRVKVLGKDGYLEGLIASKAIHHKDKKEREKTVSPDKLYIDIGARDKETAEQYVGIGDCAVFQSEFYEFGDGMLKGKALDDRMGCAAMIEMMRSLRKDPPKTDVDVYFCFTVREEIGQSGAKAAAFRIRPDIALVLETTAIADIADVPASGKVANVGSGAVISLMDRSTIYDKALIALAMDISKKTGVAAQIKRYVSGGNDAGTIHRTAEGIKTLAISVPTRYLHSAACVASIKDYVSVRDLCEQIIRSERVQEEI